MQSQSFQRLYKNRNLQVEFKITWKCQKPSIVNLEKEEQIQRIYTACCKVYYKTTIINTV